MNMRVDDFFLTGCLTTHDNTTNNGALNGYAPDQPVNIISMAREGLVPEMEVIVEGKLGQEILEKYRG